MSIPESTDYIIVRREWTELVGPLAAILLERIRWRTERRQHGWAASYAELSSDTGLTVKQVRTALTVLIDGHFVTSRSAGDGTKRRAWSFALEGRSFVDRANDSIYREDIEDNYTADASLSAQEEPMELEPVAEVKSIDGGLFPSEAVDRREPTADEWANECRTIWRTRFREATGHDPHPDTASKAFGHIKRACSRSVTQDHFRDVWRAARDAGAEGRWQVQVDAPIAQERVRWNENTHLRMLREKAGGKPSPPMLTSRERLLGTGEGA